MLVRLSKRKEEKTMKRPYLVLAAGIVSTLATAARSDVFTFSTNTPDGLIALASRPSSPGGGEIEAADDFLTLAPTQINSATFYGLIVPSGGERPAVQSVDVEFYRVFPNDSDTVRSITVPTRTNSPSDDA